MRRSGVRWSPVIVTRSTRPPRLVASRSALGASNHEPRVAAGRTTPRPTSVNAAYPSHRRGNQADSPEDRRHHDRVEDQPAHDRPGRDEPVSASEIDRHQPLIHHLRRGRRTRRPHQKPADALQAGPGPPRPNPRRRRDIRLSRLPGRRSRLEADHFQSRVDASAKRIHQRPVEIATDRRRFVPPTEVFRVRRVPVKAGGLLRARQCREDGAPQGGDPPQKQEREESKDDRSIVTGSSSLAVQPVDHLVVNRWTMMCRYVPSGRRTTSGHSGSP